MSIHLGYRCLKKKLNTIQIVHLTPGNDTPIHAKEFSSTFDPILELE